MKNYRSLVTVVVVLSTCLFLGACKKEQAETPSSAPEKIIRVAVEQIRPQALTETFSLPAKLEAWEDLTIAAEYPGLILSIPVEEGDRVKAGARLLNIDSATLKSNLAREEENVSVLSNKLERYRQLESEGLVSRQDVDDLNNGLVSAQAALKAMRLQIDKTMPSAPIAGIVDHIFVDRGEYVDPGKPLIRLLQVERLKAIADVPEKDVHFLAPGQAAELVPSSFDSRSEPYSGTIDYIAYAADEASRTYRTKLSVSNDAGLLRPGMIVRVRFVRQQLENVMTVPLYAVLDREGGKIVFVADGNTARMVRVKTGVTSGERILIETGLEFGQQLIVKGQQLLVDGSRIETGD